MSLIVAIVGAGDLGGALAFSLASRDRVGAVRLIDESGSSAAGKALDVRQSAPIHGSSVQVTGFPDIAAVDGADIVVLADAFGAPAREHQGEAGLTLLRRLAARAPSAALVLAGSSHTWLVEKAVAELALPWTRVIGSAPMALMAGLRTLIGLETGASPLDVQIAIAGLPPDHLVVAWESASAAGASLAGSLDWPTRARIATRLPHLWPPGPIALAAAASATIEAMVQGSHRPCCACIAAERRALVSTVWLTRSGVARAALPELSVQERVALDNARLR